MTFSFINLNKSNLMKVICPIVAMSDNGHRGFESRSEPEWLLTWINISILLVEMFIFFRSVKFHYVKETHDINSL